jgi:hypothetical protein
MRRLPFLHGIHVLTLLLPIRVVVAATGLETKVAALWESDIVASFGPPKYDLKMGVNRGQQDLRGAKALLRLPRLDSNH